MSPKPSQVHFFGHAASVSMPCGRGKQVLNTLWHERYSGAKTKGGEVDSLRLINIRSFADSGPIRIAPLTLLLGQNSSGKSTVARFLPLLRQTSEVLTREPLLWFGRLVDFGSADEAVSKLAQERTLGADFEFLVNKAAISRRRRGLVFYPVRSGEGPYVPAKVRVRYLLRDNQRHTFEFSLQLIGHEIALSIQDGAISLIRINGNDFTSFGSSFVASTWSTCFPNISSRDTGTSAAEVNVFAAQLQAYVRQHTHGKSGAERVAQLTRALRT